MGVLQELNGEFSPVIVKVRKAGYVPRGMTVRAYFGDVIFTADCESREALEAARKDPLVVSVNISAPLQMN